MREYEITIDDGCGNARCIVRKREDAALLCLEHAVFEALESNGLRDRPIAHIAMRKARAWTKRHPIEPIRILDHVITISTEDF